MDKLKKCAKAFQNLFDKQYIIILGRKNKEAKFKLNFDKTDFYHLVGLQKLKDLGFLRKDRSKIFDEIMADKITYEMIGKSVFFEADEEKNQFGVRNRIDYFIHIEDILDSDNLVFKYNKTRNTWSLIKYEYVFENIDYDTSVYVFIDKRNEDESRFCRSFFPREDTDYTNQTRMALIYKEKVNLTCGESIVQVNKLKH